MAHVAKVSDLAQRLGKPQGEILRDAIDEYYERHQDAAPQPEAQPAAHHPDCQCNLCTYDTAAIPASEF